MSDTNEYKLEFNAATIITFVVIIVLLAGGIGLIYWHSHKNSNANKLAATAAPAGLYAGWKSLTLPVEKLTFKYPPQWEISPSESGSPSPTQDELTFVAANGSTTFLIIDGGSAAGASSIPQATSAAIPIKFVGKDDYLAFDYAKNGQSFSDTEVAGAQLQTDPNKYSSFPKDRTAAGATVSNGPLNAKSILISCAFDPSITLIQAESSTQLRTCEFVIDSMHY